MPKSIEHTLAQTILNQRNSDSVKSAAVEAYKAQTNFYSFQSPEKLVERERRELLTTGIDSLDSIFPFPTGFYVICANPGAGKGWFSLWMSRKGFERHQKYSVFFSLEMAEGLVRERVLQQWSDLTQREFHDGYSVDQAIAALRQDVLVVDTFHADDTALQTPEEFTQKFLVYYTMGYRIFHFDHLHELEGANDGERNQRVTEHWGRVFQQLSKEYPDAWLFIYAQPNGAAANKQFIRRTDIAGSKAITQKCEFFLSLNRKLMKDENGEYVVDHENREVILWLDKSRVTSASQVGFRLYFLRTGNYSATESPQFDQVKEALL